MPSPYWCERFHPTRGKSQRKSLFLNFANATPRMQFTKVALPGFERETEIVVARALTSAKNTFYPPYLGLTVIKCPIGTGGAWEILHYEGCIFGSQYICSVH